MLYVKCKFKAILRGLSGHI